MPVRAEYVYYTETEHRSFDEEYPLFKIVRYYDQWSLFIGNVRGVHDHDLKNIDMVCVRSSRDLANIRFMFFALAENPQKGWDDMFKVGEDV